MKIKKTSLIIFFGIVLLICIFIFLRPPEPVKIQSVATSQPATPDVLAGATNIKRFSDTNKNVVSNVAVSATNKRAPVPVVARTPVPPPYPRITINFSSQVVSSIRSNDAGNGSFIITTLEIQNYGYTYFDASATKFRGMIGGLEITPLVNVSTGNMIDAVIPSNSTAKGDLVFLVSKRGTGVGKIKYLSSGYTILYHQGLSTATTNNVNPECGDNDEC
jgi:hypothetical protein